MTMTTRSEHAAHPTTFSAFDVNNELSVMVMDGVWLKEHIFNDIRIDVWYVGSFSSRGMAGGLNGTRLTVECYE